jgi:hypothetical protein
MAPDRALASLLLAGLVCLSGAFWSGNGLRPSPRSRVRPSCHPCPYWFSPFLPPIRSILIASPYEIHSWRESRGSVPL